MQVTLYHLTLLCLGKEARHLISQLCHLSEDGVCPWTCCCIPHYNHGSSREGHPSHLSHRAHWPLHTPWVGFCYLLSSASREAFNIPKAEMEDR